MQRNIALLALRQKAATMLKKSLDHSKCTQQATNNFDSIFTFISKLLIVKGKPVHF